MSPAEKPTQTQKEAEKSALPFQIQLLETHIRFETNGDSRKEVHTIVKLNNAVGAHQFARLAFDYNRTFQQLEVPQVRITHTNGGTSEVLPSALSDGPNPAVEHFPAYQDVRLKTVRLLGLEEGDTIEYRVVTTTSHAPLAPDFWLEHSFDRSGQVLKELYELDVPASRKLKVWTSENFQSFEKNSSGEEFQAREVYRWKYPNASAQDRKADEMTERDATHESLPVYLTDADVAVTTYENWPIFMRALQKFFPLTSPAAPEIKIKAEDLTAGAKSPSERLRRLYEFAAEKIATVDLPLYSSGFATRPPREILKAAYATPEDKCLLLISLIRAAGLPAMPALTGAAVKAGHGPVLPTLFTNVLVFASRQYSHAQPVPGLKDTWLDPSEPVTPYAMISATLRGKPAFLPFPESDTKFFETIPKSLPFAAVQKVDVNAALVDDGTLSAKVKYTMRGDNELLLRVAFHQTPPDKWKDVASLLAISDGFRGQVITVNASDPTATQGPFTVEYELSQPKFVDWSKKPVRIPAILPQIGLPEPPAKLTAEGKALKIELGTPLNVETQLTLHVPLGTKVQLPTGTSVSRDYATYVSKYSSAPGILMASRHINFLLREVPADRSVDYNAFLHAVQSDQAQYFVLDRALAPTNASAK